MAHTAHKNTEETKEYFDGPEVLGAKVSRLAGWYDLLNRQRCPHAVGSVAHRIDDPCAGFERPSTSPPLPALAFPQAQEFLTFAAEWTLS